MRWTPKWILSGLGLLLGIGVVVDLGRSASQSARPVPEPIPIPQVYASDPDAFAVKLIGERRARWLKQDSLEVGEPGPRLRISGNAGKEFRLPSADGKPSVLLLTSATRRSTPLVAPIRDFVQLYGEQVHIAIAVLTTSRESWEQHTNNLGKTSIVLHWDQSGEILERLRPDIANPEELPAVWGFGGKGEVRYFHQPSGVAGAWRDDLRAALGIVKAQEDLAVGSH